MTEKVAVVFTGESSEKIIGEGGTSAWRLDPTKVRRCKFVVCTRNINSAWPEVNAGWPRAMEPDRSAFLIGEIRDVVPPPEYPNRYVIRFSSYARINVLDAWKGVRNPFMYSTLAELGIEVSKLSWEQVTKSTERPQEILVTSPAVTDATFLTIPEAKLGLARTFGISPEQIEITIKG